MAGSEPEPITTYDIANPMTAKRSSLRPPNLSDVIADEIVAGVRQVTTGQIPGAPMIREHVVHYPSEFQVDGLRSRPTVEVDEATRRRYSLARALKIAMGAERATGPELDISDAYMRSLSSIRAHPGPGLDVRGDFAIPTWALFGPSAARAIDTSNSGSKGANLIFTRPGEFVAPLRPRSLALALGATFIEDAPIPMALPRQTTAPEAIWVSENPGADYAATDEPAFDRVNFGVKTLTAGTTYTKSMLAQSRSSRAIDGIIAEDMRARFGTAIDRAAIFTDTGADPNAPSGGILNDATTQIVAIGANGGVPTHDDIAQLEETVALADGDFGNLGVATTPSMRRVLRSVFPLVAGAPAGLPVWNGNQVLGAPGAVSTLVPSTLTKGTSVGVCHAIIYGNWAALVIAMAEAITVIVDPFSKKKQGLVEVQAFAFTDLALTHGKQFAAIKDATLT